MASRVPHVEGVHYGADGRILLRESTFNLWNDGKDSLA